MLLPDDATGDVLRHMEEQGDDLTRPRNIDFTVIFADESSAHQFARHFRVLGHDVSVEKAETDKRFPWDVVVVQRMIPSHDGISSFEDLLQTVASGWGGHNCDCGCFPEPS